MRLIRKKEVSIVRKRTQWRNRAKKEGKGNYNKDSSGKLESTETRRSSQEEDVNIKVQR